MLTVDFDRLALSPGSRVLDLGCGAGRHAFEAYRRGARVVAFDQDTEALAEVSEMFDAMSSVGEGGSGGSATTESGDALALPFGDCSFDRVVAAEILEHIPEDEKAIAELVRVVRPGGLVAVTVPRYWPERVCWALSRPYHDVEGGHVRIYRASELVSKLRDAGLVPFGRAHAHALHSPYWWLKCAVGVDREHLAVRAYHKILVWDLMKRPLLTRVPERLLNPVLGKSVVLYLRKPEVPRASR